ncbi:TPA: FkbM family methyltransferase [Campylobacter coli]|nr:FkbM family methyltransferase [Campylobacter coli]
MKKILEELNANIKLGNQLSYQILMSNIISNLDIDRKDKEILLLLLQARDKNYIRINHNEQCYKNIINYLELIRPLELPLDDLLRIGGNGDGGYVMYNAERVGVLSNTDAKAISLGVSESSPWDLEMAQRGFKVIEYDASIEKCPYNHENIVFYKKFIGSVNNASTITLTQALKDNNLDENKPNILQCDIENCEWEMLENIDIGLLNKYFSQVIFEFHGCNPEEQDGVEKRVKLLKKLNEYFVPIHAHFHNHGKIFYSNGLFFSTTLEVSYLRKNLINNLNIMKYRNVAGGFKNLDFPWVSNPEIPIRFKG